jgi:hypothetical protein
MQGTVREPMHTREERTTETEQDHATRIFQTGVFEQMDITCSLLAGMKQSGTDLSK